MDLETIIPIVIIAAAYLFKAFENAGKKDTKKSGTAPKKPAVPAKPAASRRVERPAAAPARVPQAGIPEGRWWEETTEVPARETRPAGQRYPGKEDAPPVFRDRPRKPVASKTEQAGKSLVTMEKEYAERIKTSREARQRRKVTEVIQLEDAVREEGLTHEYAEFDLRDAVIKSVILERREF